MRVRVSVGMWAQACAMVKEREREREYKERESYEKYEGPVSLKRGNCSERRHHFSSSAASKFHLKENNCAKSLKTNLSRLLAKKVLMWSSPEAFSLILTKLEISTTFFFTS